MSVHESVLKSGYAHKAVDTSRMSLIAHCLVKFCVVAAAAQALALR